MNELTPSVNEAIQDDGYKKKLRKSWNVMGLKKKFQALGGTYKALKAERGLNAKNKPDTGSSLEDVQAFDQ